MALKSGVICLRRRTPKQLTRPQVSEATKNAVLQVKTSANAGMAILENLGAGIDLARGESFEGIKMWVLSRNKTFV